MYNTNLFNINNMGIYVHFWQMTSQQGLLIDNMILTI